MIYKGNDTFKQMLMVLRTRDSRAFEEFKQQLQDKGLKTALIQAQSRTDSIFAVRNGGETRRVPCLTIYTEDAETYQAYLGKPVNMELMDEEKAQCVIEAWKEICVKYGYDINEYCDNEMYIHLRNIQRTVGTHIVRQEKEKAEVIVAKRCGIKPRDIYASSVPSFHIVFSDEQEYQKAERYFARISGDIKEMLEKEAKKYGISVEEVVQIVFWHPKKEGYNGYGLARED